MNPNAYEVSIYMIIHLIIFLAKKYIFKIINKIVGNESKNNNNEIEIMKQKMESLNEQIREISPTNEYAKYAKIERQINKLNTELNQKEKGSDLKNMKDSKNNYSFLDSHRIIFFMVLIFLIEYFLIKNKYLEVDYEYNKNNIVANYFYNVKDNKYYALVPVYRIIICEELVLNSIQNIIQKLF